MFYLYSGANHCKRDKKDGTKKCLSGFLSKIFLLSIAGTCVASDASNKWQMDNATKQSVITDTQQLIQQEYVEVSKIPNIVSGLEALKTEEFVTGIKDRNQLIAALNTRLQANDKHFSISIDPKSFQSGQDVKSLNKVAPVKETWFEKLERQNYGFERVEVLANNIGIIDFWGFADLTSDAKATIKGFLNELKNVDALIIDLSKNGGGSAQTVQYMSSFFLPGKVHLNSFYSRATNSTQDFHTDENINYSNLNEIPIVIIVGPETFSAAEEFAYNFKHLSRAVIIGQSTKGGANPWRYFALSHGLRIAIPTAKAINPITQSNWEGVGVQPHMQVELATAVSTAIGLLTRQTIE